ncbi:winged helix-turn-helix transcriptional regulator [Krasilnikovia sp. MM14-A1259]|uniref:winged helix-turn-helix transcriptional regulator n=1 Tax=Krasilnikovia sp. MM14-A1259 TaxID=3373539 RepID=UPI00399C7E82
MTNVLQLILNIARRKLAVSILIALQEGPQRYSRLLHAVSRTSPGVVHARTLTDNLTFLQDEGLVEHHHDPEAADYRLTQAGSDLVDLFGYLGRWDEEHRNDDE